MWYLSERERECGMKYVSLFIFKKLRDTSNTKLSSYAIKTVILFEKDSRNPEFWKNRLAYIFLWVSQQYLMIAI